MLPQKLEGFRAEANAGQKCCYDWFDKIISAKPMPWGLWSHNLTSRSITNSTRIANCKTLHILNTPWKMARLEEDTYNFTPFQFGLISAPGSPQCFECPKCSATRDEFGLGNTAVSREGCTSGWVQISLDRLAVWRLLHPDPSLLWGWFEVEVEILCTRYSYCTLFILYHHIIVLCELPARSLSILVLYHIKYHTPVQVTHVRSMIL